MNSDHDLIVRTVREFVEREVLPVASDMERHDTYPEALVATMGAFTTSQPITVENGKTVNVSLKFEKAK